MALAITLMAICSAALVALLIQSDQLTQARAQTERDQTHLAVLDSQVDQLVDQLNDAEWQAKQLASQLDATEERLKAAEQANNGEREYWRGVWDLCRVAVGDEAACRAGLRAVSGPGGWYEQPSPGFDWPLSDPDKDHS